MKRLVLIAALFAIGFSAQAQVEKENALTLSPKDSLLLNRMEEIAKSVANNTPRYKLYKTDNLYNLILLDTATGRLWQVQYEMNDKAEAMKVPINDNPFIREDDPELRNGRFELYPTNNTYTFILIDTEKGWPFQVQWSTDPKERFRKAIY